MTEDDILEIGDMLEEKGLSHSEIDSYFEHHGVVGMKWGVRRRNRIARTVMVGKGKGTISDKLRVHAYANPVDVVRKASFRKGAALKGARMMRREDRMANGRGKARDVLISIGTARASDVLPSVMGGALKKDASRDMAKISSGAAFALALPMAAWYVAGQVSKSAARKRGM